MLDLLVHCHEFTGFSSGPRYAAALANGLGAAITGIYVAPALQAPPAWSGQPSLSAEYLAYVHEERERAQLARGEFARWATRAGARSPHWQLAVGDISEALIAAGNGADICVIEHRVRAPDHSLPTIERVLRSGLPCIVVPEEESNARPAWERVAIAWNGSAGAVRAVHAALPVLRIAREIFVLLSPRVVSGTRMICEPEFSIERYFELHGLKATWTAIDRNDQPFDQVALVEVSRLGADLLVMGAFGTARFHTSHSTGITNRVLQQSLLPVFARH